MDIAINLYRDATRGEYVTEIQSRGVPADSLLLGAQSADLSFSDEAVNTDISQIIGTMLTASPIGLERVCEGGRLIAILMYRAIDQEAMLAFDRRISEEYTAYYSERGIYYSGALQAQTPEGTYLMELLAYDTRSKDEADRLGNEDLSDRIVEIEDECRSLQDPSQPKFIIWLQPKH